MKAPIVTQVHCPVITREDLNVYYSWSGVEQHERMAERARLMNEREMQMQEWYRQRWAELEGKS